jgi:hypothetical protein
MKRLAIPVFILLFMAPGLVQAGPDCEDGTTVQCVVAQELAAPVSLGPIPMIHCDIAQVDGSRYCSPCENGREVSSSMLNERCNARYPRCNGRCVGSLAW